MKLELEEHARSIVGQLAASPAAERDGLRNHLCGDDAELRSAVADLWRVHLGEERTEFWERPADALLSPSETPTMAQDLDNSVSQNSGTQAKTPALAKSARQQGPAHQ